jgi:23S rRNA (uridine2552-2'-O)-methyltransferase
MEKKPLSRQIKVKLKTAQNRTLSSQLWLSRQLNDPYVHQAKAQGYRSRSAFKLKEIDDKYQLLKPGLRVVDLGAAPGGWTQVAVERTAHPHKPGKIIGIDLSPMDPIEGATLLEGDFLDPHSIELITQYLAGINPQERPLADLIISDMAAAATGHTQTDHWRIIGLVEAALELVKAVLAPGGSFVAKVLQGGTEARLLNEIKKMFKKVTHFKPPASRKGSAEMYLVATGFREMPRPKPSVEI